jgi:hypothetical protein
MRLQAEFGPSLSLTVQTDRVKRVPVARQKGWAKRPSLAGQQGHGCKVQVLRWRNRTWAERNDDHPTSSSGWSWAKGNFPRY